jgi:photosystem II stability/assembly factor-like uncharacterized protein
MWNCAYRSFPSICFSYPFLLIYLIAALITPTAYGEGNWWISKGPEKVGISTLAIDPQTPSTVYAGTLGGGVFKSTNGGGIWTAVNSGLTSTNVNALAIDPQTPATVYAGTSGGGVFKSTDGGGIWSAVNSGLTNIYVFALAIDPQTPATVYAGTSLRRVFKSTDGGGIWTAVFDRAWLLKTGVFALAIDPQTPVTVYAGTDGGGVFKSTDGGGIWTAVNVWPTNALAIDPQTPATVYAGTKAGLYKSTDGGNIWTKVNNGLTNTYVRALAIDPQTPATIYAGTSGGVFRSTDGGGIWTAVNSGLTSTSVFALAIDPQSPTTVYAGTLEGVFKLVSDTSNISATVGAGGAAQYETPGMNEFTRAGYAKLTLESGKTPDGTAVFSFKRVGVTVTEAGVPASPPTTRARIFIEYRNGVNAVPGRNDAGTVDVNTGIAVVNYGSATANVAFTLRDMAGATLTTGHGTMAAGNHFACFIHELKDKVAPDFNLPSDFQNTTQFRSLEMSSDQPLSALGLRGTYNQRRDFLITTTPVADVTKPFSDSPIYFPQFVDGGGYTTSLILLNASGVTETGSLQIMDNDGAPLVVNQVGSTPGSSFRYSIQPNGVSRFQTDGFPTEVKAGWARLIPDAGTSAPIGSGIFGFNPQSILVSESGIPSADATTHPRVYVDLSGKHNTGLAIANVAGTNASITIKAFQSDGVTEIGTSQDLPPLNPHGHTAAFANEFISGLPAGFTGVLDISSTTRFAALTLRSLYNERDDFMMTTFPVADADMPAPSPIIFPQVVDGGGYITQFILISPTEGASTTLNFYAEDGTPWVIAE